MSAAASLVVFGVVVHLVVDWLGQNDWMATHKAQRGKRQSGVFIDAESGRPLEFDGPWWDRHPAAYVHAGIHGAAQLLVFPWWGALVVGVTHLLIDTRVPVAWWSRLIRQTQPQGISAVTWDEPRPVMLYDIGTDVRIWADQVWHIGVVALVALVAS